MVQELLNRSDDHLWAILTNATTLRLLRDSTSLVGSAYVEFDLEAIFDGELFTDFLLLYRCATSPASKPRHRGRARLVLAGAVAPGRRRVRHPGAGPAARRRRRRPQTLGTGFLAHPDNADAARRPRRRRRLTVDDSTTRCCASSTGCCSPSSPRTAARCSTRTPTRRRASATSTYFSTDRLAAHLAPPPRRPLRRPVAGPHAGLRGLGSDDGLPELGLPGIGGLFDTGELDVLTDCSLSNQALHSAVRSLSVVREPKSQACGSSTTATSAPRNSAASTRRCSNSCRSWDPATKTYELVDRLGQRAQGHRLLLHPHLAGRVAAGHRARPGARRRGEVRRSRSRRC